MDLSVIIVVVVMTAMALGAIVWLEIHSRRKHKTESLAEKAGPGGDRGDAAGNGG